MLRVRLTVLVTLAALLAPWVAPCLASAPVGHAQMPCCRTAGDGVPTARPCCTPADPQPLAPTQTAASSTGAVPCPSFTAMPATISVARVHLVAARLAPLPLQLRSTVLLI